MNALFEACGAIAPWQLSVESASAPPPELSPFHRPFLVLGQDPSSDLQLAHKDVSDRHAFFQWIRGRLYVVDLGSRTGILYDGRRQRTGWLEPGRSIRIGPYRIALRDAQEVVPPDDESAIPTLALELKLRGIRALSACAEGELVVLGNAPDCDVRLLDPAVSSYHCALVNTARGLWVVDLLGAGGTAVNGESVRCAPLSEGDLLAIGRSTVHVASLHWAESAPAAARPPSWQPPLEPVRSAVRERAQHDHQAPAHAEWSEPTSNPRNEYEIEPQSEPPAQPAAAPRRSGFFAPWRRTPVPLANRAASVPTVLPHTDDPLGPAPVRGEPNPNATGWDVQASAPRWEDPSPPAARWSVSGQPLEPLPAGPEGSERRTSCRYAVSARRAFISWREPESPTGHEFRGRFDSAKVQTSANARISPHGTARGPAEPARDDPTGQDDPLTRTVAVSMVDVSNAGLAVLSPVAPPGGEPVWFRLEDEPGIDWIELMSVGTARAGSGQYSVRFSFRDTCPYDLFKALVLGASRHRA